MSKKEKIIRRAVNLVFGVIYGFALLIMNRHIDFESLVLLVLALIYVSQKKY